MVSQGDKILALDEKGILRMIQADTSKLNVISERSLGVPECWAHLAVVV